MNTEIINFWIKDLRGTNQNTYKYALQRAILLNPQQDISIDRLAESFVEIYWNNVVCFKLRETNNIAQQPLFHKGILKTAATLGLSNTTYLHAKKIYPNLTRRVLDDLDKPFSDILKNPISRLQYDYKTKSANGDATGSGWLYEWDIKAGIRIKTDHIEALKVLNTALNNLSVYCWALFLEKYNHVPAILNKLEDLKGSRTIAADIRRFIIQNTTNQCFYCQSRVPSDQIEIDHFIPYAYLFDSPIWDLVVSCVSCNRGTGGKFDQLGDSSLLEQLVVQNDQLFQLDRVHFREFVNQSGQFDFNDRLHREYQASLNAGFSIWKRSGFTSDE